MSEDTGSPDGGSKESSPSSPVFKKKPKGVISRVWSAIFGNGGDNFEKKLEHITKEETSVLARMKRRSQAWRTIIRQLIQVSVLLEVIAVSYAIMTTRSLELDWKMRAFRVLPMFLLPAVCSIAYSAFVSITRICDQRDRNTLERLRAERQEKINELKEKTNYYSTQQLIQRYDPDPAAKAAAATILASKLGADSGLRVYIEDESKLNVPGGKSKAVEALPSSGLRNRKQMLGRSNSTGSTPLLQIDEEITRSAGNEAPQASEQDRLVVDHYDPQVPSAHDGGWLARFAALLVGEDPRQSYALICGNCHMHNGLARKEDFSFITYYCPHCNALNRPKQSKEDVSTPSPPLMNPLKSEGAGHAVQNSSGSMGEDVPTNDSPVRSRSANDSPVKSGPANDSPLRPGSANDSPVKSGPANDSPLRSGPANDSPVKPGPEIEEVTEKLVPSDLVE